MPTYPLPLLVEVWGGYTLERSVNSTLRKVLQTDGMQAVIGGPYYLNQDLPHPFHDIRGPLAKSLTYQA